MTNNKKLLTMNYLKQTQTKPNEPNLYCVYLLSILKRTQTKPILPAFTAGKIALSEVEGPVKIVPSFTRLSRVYSPLAGPKGS
jgi:hypothetical protein